MKLSDGVEWAIHCTALLTALPADCTLTGKAMAEYHGVPESYLLKHLKALTSASILESITGPRGGYRLARAPEDITLLDIVDAIEGREPAFRCTEIRRRGPCAVGGNSAYSLPCGINSAMLRAEAAYREALSKETLEKIREGFLAIVDPRCVVLNQDWLSNNVRKTKS